MAAPINIFVIYAREDKEIKQRLLLHLNPFKNAFNATIWHDEFIEPGQEWRPSIESRLAQTDLFLLLVSIDFMNSEFINQVEFKYAMDRHKAGTSIAVPVIINYCQWDIDIDFKEYTFNLNQLQVLPTDAKPIGDWKTPEQAYNNIAAGIRVVLASIKDKRERERLLQVRQEEEKANALLAAPVPTPVDEELIKPKAALKPKAQVKPKKESPPVAETVADTKPVDEPRKSNRLYYIIAGIVGLAVIVYIGFFSGRNRTVAADQDSSATAMHKTKEDVQKADTIKSAVPVDSKNTPQENTGNKNTVAIDSNKNNAGKGLRPIFPVRGINAVSDVDRNLYTTIKIGTQTWMQQNLKTTHYSDGTPIPNIINNEAWKNSSTGGYGNYQNAANYVAAYGRYYNWFAVNNPAGICPKGWHIPSHNDWLVLVDFLGGDNVAGGALKATTLWALPNTGASNSSGFAALPGGYRYAIGTSHDMGNYAYFWSADQYNATQAYQLDLRSFDGKTNIKDPGRVSVMDKRSGITCRCIKD